jgi:hypothetical protein
LTTWSRGLYHVVMTNELISMAEVVRISGLPVSRIALDQAFPKAERVDGELHVKHAEFVSWLSGRAGVDIADAVERLSTAFSKNWDREPGAARVFAATMLELDKLGVLGPVVNLVLLDSKNDRRDRPTRPL